MADQIFADGIYYNKKSEKTPAFIIASFSFDVAKFSKFLREHENEKGYVRVDFKKNKDGTKQYFALNNFQPKKADKPQDLGDAPF